MRDLVFEERDLSDFRGQSIVIDADSLLYWMLEEYLPRLPHHYLGDYGPDLLTACR